MANTAKTRDQTLDALKGVAIFLVMLGHVLNLNHMEDPYLYDCIRAVQMPLFMMVSGYLCGMGRRVTDLGSYKAVLKKRAISYLLPFFAWIVVIYPLELPGAIWDTLFHLDYGLWFLMTLFLLTVMVYTAQLVSSLAKERRWIKELLFWGAYGLMAAFILVETIVGWEFLSPTLTRMYLPFYMAGYVVTAYGLEGKEKIRKGKTVLAILSAMIFFYLVIVYDLVDLETPQAFLRQTAASFTGCFFLFWLCKKWPDGKTKRAAAWLGNYTLEIYALHFHFATLLHTGAVYQLYTPEGLLFVLASFAVMSLITAAILFVTKKIWILDFLLYGKNPKKKLEKKPGKK